MSKCYLAAIGDANDIRTWSGIPFHLLQESKRQGVIDEGLPLATDGIGWSTKRYLWNLLSLVRGRGIGGFQNSVGFLEDLWKPHIQKVNGQRLLNCFQLYPPSLIGGATELSFFLDQTLRQLFETYGVGDQVGDVIARESIEREKQGYEQASHIVMHSEWARRSVVEDYSIAPEKVSVIVPGANLDPEAYESWAEVRNERKDNRVSPLRLVFVGKDPQRKGLDRLLRALQIVASKGEKCSLRIIGCQETSVAPELREIDGVEWYGFVDKRYHAAKYLDAVGSCDVGCLLSRSEAGGIGLREYHALGLAVIGPQVGGSPDHVVDGAARLIPPTSSDDDIAETIVELINDREQVRSMQALSWQNRNKVSWTACVRKLGERMKETA